MKSTIPENRARFSLAEVARITGGTLSGSGDAVVEGVATDSRVPIDGKLFVALTGERFDGHVYASAALRSGATALLVERDLGAPRVPTVRVASTLEALGKLGTAHRRRSGARVVAVAGSAGKTTTRSAIGAALEAAAPGRVHCVPGNLNNAVGVPLVLLALGEQHRFAVVEIGTNAPGEVLALARIAEPDAAVLTLIGLEHTAGLGDIDRIEAEEGSLYAALSAEGVAIGNGDDARVARQLGRAPASTKLRYGFGEGLEYRILERTPGELGPSRVRLARMGREELSVTVPWIGRPGAYAVAAAVAAAEAVTGVTLSAAELEAAFERNARAEPGRLVPLRLANDAVVLDDTYNSNPASLASSVAAAAEIARARGGRLLLVLGEMRELGEDSPRLHREAGEALVDAGAALVVAVGGDARWLLEPFERAHVATLFALDAQTAAPHVVRALAPRDVVLVKASRGVRAERVVEALLETYGSAR